MSLQRLNVAFLNIFCIAHMSQRMPSKNLQAPNFGRFGWDIAHQWAWMNQLCLTGWQKDPILVCKSYIITAFLEVSLWKSNFFIQTTMMNCKQISQDVSIPRSLLRSNGWRVPWRLSGGASVLPQKCGRFSNTPPLARPLWPISTAHELYVWRLGW